MSVVERVRVLQVTSPLVHPFVTAVRRTADLDAVLIEVTDAEGRVGWGEAAVSWRVTGESPVSVAAVVAGPLGEAVIGRVPGDSRLDERIRQAVWRNDAARSAVACALADLEAQQQGVTLSRLIAGQRQVSTEIRTDMTLSIAEPHVLAKRAQEHLAEGFRCLKVKVSRGHDPLAGLQAVHAVVGDAVTLRVDANQAWGTQEAIREIRRFEDAGLALEFVEQPVRVDDLDGLVEVTDAVSTPIMADESVRTSNDVRVIALAHAADLVNVKLAKTGGIAEAVAAVDVAQELGLGVVFGCMLESHVGVSAAAHLAAALLPDVVHDLDAAFWLRRSPVSGGFEQDRDRIVLAGGFGIGIAGVAAGMPVEVLADVGRHRSPAA